MLNGDTDDLERLIYGGDYLLPEKDSFSSTDPSGVVRPDIGVGWQKSQLQYVSALEVMSVTYKALSKGKIDFIDRFLKRNRGQAFVAMLPNKRNQTEERVCQFIDSPVKFTKTGFNGSVELTLQVEPSDNPCFEAFLDLVDPCWGDSTCGIANALDGAVKAWPNG